MQSTNNFTAVEGDHYKWLHNAATNGRTHIAYTAYGLTLLASKGLIKEHLVEELTKLADFPYLFSDLPCAFGNGFCDEVGEYKWWNINADPDEIDEEELCHVASAIGANIFEYGCKSCWEDEKVYTAYKDFDGEVIETCPRCHSEAVTQVPMEKDDLYTTVRANITISIKSRRAKLGAKIK